MYNSSIDEGLIAYIVKYQDLNSIQKAGIDQAFFVDEFRSVYKFLYRMKRDHDQIPSEEVLLARFPDLRIGKIRRKDLPILIRSIRQRKKWSELLAHLNDAAAALEDYEHADGVIQKLQSQLNTLTLSSDTKSHLVDLFSEKTRKMMEKEIERRRIGEVKGIPTGFKKLDEIGGLQKQRMITIIGRTGKGKSWLDLFFVASAVISGHKVILYPLEMSLAETAFRLYTIFTQKCFGGKRVLKNMDLSTGKVTAKKVTKFLMALEDRYKGQLYVADVSSLADPYTNERIEAEVEIHKPDMFWVDYLTLLKPPSGYGEDWREVRQLSNGIKTTAMRRNCIGGASAQVNRESLKVNAFLPRIEHISYGDSIGHDSDWVISINKRADYLYYGLTKNRLGPEIPRQRLRADVNIGLLLEQETEE